VIRFERVEGEPGLHHEELHIMATATGSIYDDLEHIWPVTDAGLDLIKHFEGYHREQPDGSCVAYICPAGKATLGWGCTHGITLGMRWTREEAEQGLLRELTQYAAEVDRAVTVPLTPDQRDALVSFTYNVGGTALRRSTLLKKVNKGDFVGAEAEFGRWVYGSDGGSSRKIKYAGLVRRRKAEAALFASTGVRPVPNAPAEQRMPQEPATKPIKVPWYSAPIAALSAVGAWFSDKLEYLANALEAAGGQFLSFAPVSSMMEQAGVAIAPVMAGIAALSVFIGLKTVLKDDEAVE
jgi:GH24 family phage-related lysozyme (muramidase)